MPPPLAGVFLLHTKGALVKKGAWDSLRITIFTFGQERRLQRLRTFLGV